MVNNEQIDRNVVSLVDKLKAYINDDEDYGIMRADLNDLIEASEWLLLEVKKIRSSDFKIEEAEDFLISLDINYVAHAKYHFPNFRY